MVEAKTKRDILVESHTAFIGDDTGLIKKVKVIAKRIEETQEIKYDVPRPDLRRKVDDYGNAIVLKPRKKGALGEKDNQTVVR